MIEKKTKISSFVKLLQIIANKHFVLCLFVLIFFAACDKINIFSRPYVATVNGAKIYLDDYQIRLNQKMSMLPKDVLAEPNYVKRLEEEVLDTMITEKIMYLRAQELVPQAPE